jgi:opacity protein-like surface antigen
LALIAGLAAQQANAQALRGFRVEAQTGYDQFSADGGHHHKLGVGGAAGVDFDLGGFVLGPEVTFWWAPDEVRTRDGAGFVRHKSFEEWALALRGGVNVTPSTFVYGKVGYVRNEQRKLFIPDVGTCGGNACQAPGYYDHYNVYGLQWGGGINQMLGGGFYASVEGRYSDYKRKLNSGGTHRIVGLVGLGYLFGASEPAPPPPPPPATQTCPDGSVILATDTCPAPPPPPPPPPPPAERGERGQ